MEPTLLLHPLSRADGSTVFSDGLYTIVAGVNGPVEVQRRDEIPEAAAIEVNVRPSSGVGGPRERWLESVIHAVVKSVLLVHLHPRTLIQITLQLAKEPQVALQRSVEDVALIPTLVNSAFLALIDGGLPLATTMSAILAVTSSDGSISLAPEEKEIRDCGSIHAFAFTQEGEQVLCQSSGDFDFELWQRVADDAQGACLSAIASLEEDAEMLVDSADKRSTQWLRKALVDRARSINAWRETT